MLKKDLVQLSTHQRRQRSALIQKGHASARTIRRAHTRPLADEEPPATTIPAVLHTSAVTVTQTYEQHLAAGLKAALYDRPRPGARRTLDGRQDPQLIGQRKAAPRGW